METPQLTRAPQAMPLAQYGNENIIYKNPDTGALFRLSEPDLIEHIKDRATRIDESEDRLLFTVLDLPSLNKSLTRAHCSSRKKPRLFYFKKQTAIQVAQNTAHLSGKTMFVACIQVRGNTETDDAFTPEPGLSVLGREYPFNYVPLSRILVHRYAFEERLGISLADHVATSALKIIKVLS